ncbi:hypothetical protein [Bradyrhizobium brasilense]|uniref:hypothetical protein n=1 Tax=Bradyrhizobium brasilense TaxID=1419277 RepID=UPI0024BFE9E4|nr:hypothetical protein [Bradyrhizobium brasilense]
MVAVPINAKRHPREVAFILDNSGAAVVFVTEDMARMASEALALGTAKPRIVEIGSAEHRGLEKTEGIAPSRMSRSPIAPGSSTPAAPPASRRARC